MKNFIGSKSRLLIGISVLIAILSISNSCSKSSYNNMTGISGSPGGSGTGGPGVNEVFIQSFAFSPSTITVVAGTTITWTNKDAANHTVTSTSGIFDSGTLGTNATYSHTFADKGTFAYKCTFHSSMTASVIVN